jgi:hypothetical protein
LLDAPELMDSLSAVPNWMNFQCEMSATAINNTLYGCNNWRFTKANAKQIQPDTPEYDAPEENLRYYRILCAGEMEHWEHEWRHVTLHMNSLNMLGVLP